MNSNGLGPWSFFFFFFNVTPYPPQVVKGSMSALVEKLKTERKEGEGNSGLKETLSRLFYN